MSSVSGGTNASRIVDGSTPPVLPNAEKPGTTTNGYSVTTTLSQDLAALARDVKAVAVVVLSAVAAFAAMTIVTGGLAAPFTAVLGAGVVLAASTAAIGALAHSILFPQEEKMDPFTASQTPPSSAQSVATQVPLSPFKEADLLRNHPQVNATHPQFSPKEKWNDLMRQAPPPLSQPSNTSPLDASAKSPIAGAASSKQKTPIYDTVPPISPTLPNWSPKMSRDTAELLLGRIGKGSYFLRPSSQSTSANPIFALSIGGGRGQPVQHYRIAHTNQGFKIQDSEGKTFKTIEDLLNSKGLAT